MADIFTKQIYVEKIYLTFGLKPMMRKKKTILQYSNNLAVKVNNQNFNQIMYKLFKVQKLFLIAILNFEQFIH